MLLCVLSSLKELGEFIKVTDSGLQKEVEEGDYEGLVFIMVTAVVVVCVV